MNRLLDSEFEELKSKYERLIPYLVLKDINEIERRMTPDIKEVSKLGYLLKVRSTVTNEVTNIEHFCILHSYSSILVMLLKKDLYRESDCNII